MKYSITIKSALSLEVCVGEFETFDEAKEKMAELIVDLIDNQKDDMFDAWENLKEDFSGQTRSILVNYEFFGEADLDDVYDDEGEDDDTSYSLDGNNFEISGKYDKLGYKLSINTNTINMYDPEENYFFTLTEGYKGGKNELTISLLVNDGDVEVYNMIPDDVRSRLEPVDLDDE